ncbi:hypothetical protein JOF29_005051 [Kribbella aluminosa]|uniref:Amidophosphoribosyltransferase n=1 Tax=Kribbella aluminosa TaxID=416017 RepID=A0ABS4UQL6_9ACTN|nr:phosphoribosyltransferase [Kribbella aluminosa]MBP2353941.1 hypothetical protein [Kribbella aluminosa]
MSSSDAWQPYRESVARQAIFLRNPLPPGPGVCFVCRSAAKDGYDVCYPCRTHRDASHLTSDAVVPIAYALKGAQHAHHLATYKFEPPSYSARAALQALSILFLGLHRPCFEQAAGGRLTHAAVVPSTRGRRGVHPLQALLMPSISLPFVSARPGAEYAKDDRTFRGDRFTAPVLPNARVLLLDDTWTTGARAQSLSHTLKSAGARCVITVVLGRHVNGRHDGSKALVEQAKSTAFDIGRCSLDS